MTDMSHVFLHNTALPTFFIQPMDVTVKTNSGTQLHCMSNGAVSYTWEKQNGVIPSDAEGVNSNTLTLFGITLSDGGQYRCVAINEHGRSYSDYATVTVTGKMFS